MGAKLVIIKQVRPNTGVAFFSRSDAQKAATRTALATEGIRSSAGESNFANGLKKVRTLFFPTVELYNKWESSPTVASLTSERAAYNTANGITETKTVVDLPNYTL